jgi:hypothetical protein
MRHSIERFYYFPRRLFKIFQMFQYLYFVLEILFNLMRFYLIKIITYIISLIPWAFFPPNKFVFDGDDGPIIVIILSAFNYKKYSYGDFTHAVCIGLWIYGNNFITLAKFWNKDIIINYTFISYDINNKVLINNNKIIDVKCQNNEIYEISYISSISNKKELCFNKLFD